MENNSSIFSLNADCVQSYSNPMDLRSTIYKENLNKAGIYRWTNLKSGKIYIGSSANLAKRFSSYFSIRFLTRESLKYKSVIYFALLKYGHSAFRLDILEYCDPKELLAREQFYLDLLKPQYNILKIAGSLTGYLHSEETKKKLSDIFKGNMNSKNQPNAVLVEVIDLETGKTTQYTSARKAAEDLNISNSTVMRRLRGESFKPALKRYVFKYCT